MTLMVTAGTSLGTAKPEAKSQVLTATRSPATGPGDKGRARTGWSIPPHHGWEAGTGEAWEKPAVPGAWAAAVRISGSPGGEAPVIPSPPLKI